jgi:major intracellular serine protease
MTDKIKFKNFGVDKVIEKISYKDLEFLNLTGRNTYYSQGIFGENTIIAVVDTGVASHSELRHNLLPGESFVDYTNRPYDDNGHGTHVAGSIAGKNVGVAPKAKILPVKVLGKDGSGSLQNLIDGLYWISDYQQKTDKKITAVNMSLSAGKDLDKETLKALHEPIQKLVKNNIAVIVSAGNSGKLDVNYPAAYDEVISVGAVDINRKRALFSTMGDYIDVCQVGVDVVSAWYKGGYAVMSGTSMSAPLVSGIAALIASKYKQVFSEDINEDYLWKSLKLNTKDLGIKGADRKYGVGFCTLQPLEADILLKNNSSNLIINGKKYRLDGKVNIEEHNFELPSEFLENITGAYCKFYPKNKRVKLLY